MDLDEAETLWALGELRREDLPNIAIDAMAHGLDSPSLRVLAGLTSAEGSEAWDVWTRALHELGRRPLDVGTAIRRSAAGVARCIAAGTLDPETGARRLWDISSRQEVRDSPELRNRLLVYGGLVSELDDAPAAREKLEQQIRTEATALVDAWGRV